MKQVKKFVAIVIVFATMLTLVACGEDETKETKKTTEPATETSASENREPTIQTETSESEVTNVTDEPNLTLPSDANITETTETAPAPDGQYVYTVYEGTECAETFALEVDIDEYFYIVEKTGNRFFDLPRLCKDLGYELIDGNGNLVPDGEHSGRHINCVKDDCVVSIFFSLDNNDVNNKYFDAVRVCFYDSNNNPYYDEEEVEGLLEYYYAKVHFLPNQEMYSFIDGVYNYSYAMSYDDIVLLVYMMSYSRDNLKNPFFHTSWQNKCSVSDGRMVEGYFPFL